MQFRLNWTLGVATILVAVGCNRGLPPTEGPTTPSTNEHSSTKPTPVTNRSSESTEKQDQTSKASKKMITANPPTKENAPVLTAQATFSEHPFAVDYLAFSEDGKSLASYSDRTGEIRDLIIIWDVESGKKVVGLKGYYGPFGTGIGSLHFSNNAAVLCISPGYNVGLGWCVLTLDAKTDKVLRKFQCPGAQEMNCGAISSDGKTVAGGADNKVVLWNSESEKEPKTLGTHAKAVKKLCFSADGMTLMSVGSDNAVKIWDVKAMKETRAFQADGDSDRVVRCSAISADGGTVAVPGTDGKAMKFWDAKTGAEKGSVSALKTPVRTVALSPNGAVVALGENADLFDKAFPIALHATKSGDHIARLDGHTMNLNCLVFSPDGRLLASGSRDKTVKLWKVPEAASPK